MDEPTNNLDSKTLEFLESFIQSKKEDSAFIIVSHDRQLLENMADKILEIDSIRIYKGTFIIVTHDRYFLNRIGNYKVYGLG